LILWNGYDLISFLYLSFRWHVNKVIDYFFDKNQWIYIWVLLKLKKIIVLISYFFNFKKLFIKKKKKEKIINLTVFLIFYKKFLKINN